MKADGGEAVGFVGPAIRGHSSQATNQVAVIPLSVIIAFTPILRTRSMIGAGMYLTFSWNPPIAGAGLPMRS